MAPPQLKSQLRHLIGSEPRAGKHRGPEPHSWPVTGTQANNYRECSIQKLFLESLESHRGRVTDYNDSVKNCINTFHVSSSLTQKQCFLGFLSGSGGAWISEMLSSRKVSLETRDHIFLCLPFSKP